MSSPPPPDSSIPDPELDALSSLLDGDLAGVPEESADPDAALASLSALLDAPLLDPTPDAPGSIDRAVSAGDPMRVHRTLVGVLIAGFGSLVGLALTVVGFGGAIVGDIFGNGFAGLLFLLGLGGVPFGVGFVMAGSRFTKDGVRGRVAGYFTAIVLLLGFPVTTPIGIYGLWVLSSPKRVPPRASTPSERAT
jgi:hypothetical protein